MLPWQQNFWITTIGSFSNDDDGDGNENSYRAISLYQQNDNLECASRLFVHCLAAVTRRARFMEQANTCLVPVRRFPSPSRSIRFGDVSEANGRETHFRMDHVTRNALAARENEAQGLGKANSTQKFLFLFLSLNTVLSDSTPENFANI